MRKELEQLQLIEAYNNGQMNAEERTRFEKLLQSNSQLAEANQWFTLVSQAVKRKVLRSEIDQITKGNGGNLGKALIGVVSVIALASALYFGLNSNNISGESPVAKVSTTQDHPNTYHPNVDQDSSQSFIEKFTRFFVGEEDLEPNKSSLAELDDKNGKPTQPTLGGHKIWAMPTVQTFEFDTKEGATLEGENGTLIIVPDDAFVDSSGEVLNGNVEFELVEAFDISDMVLLRLETKSNGDMLKSGGMFYTQVRVNGQEAFINPERPLYMEIPTPNYNPKMKLFEGEVDSSGNLNWVKPKDLKKFLVKQPLNSLDFLPKGFRETAHGLLPFQNIKRRNKSTIDSLYYSLAWGKSYEVILDSDDLLDSRTEIEAMDFDKRLLVEVDQVKRIRNKDEIATADTTASTENCGINPASIHTIYNQKFANSYVSTIEFEYRVKQLHELDNGEKLLQHYINNLSTDMYLSDSTVASQLTGQAKLKFDSLYQLKHSNLKESEIYADRLSTFYKNKRDAFAKKQEKIRGKLQRKNYDDLDALYSELDKNNKKYANEINRLGKPNVANSQTYSFFWSAGGWGNIDAYFKLLKGDPVELPILAKSSVPTKQFDVTQWLNAINNYTDLVPNEGKYVAKFPEKSNSMKNTFAFALGQQEDNTYLWDMKQYNPYEITQLELLAVPSTMNKIKADLASVNQSWGLIAKNMQAKKKLYLRMIKAQKEQEARIKKWRLQQAELRAELNKKKAEIEAQKRFRNRLEMAAFPCFSYQSDSIEVKEEDYDILETSSPFNTQSIVK